MTYKELSKHMRQAQNELSRANHLIYVSLKYSRTVDVLQSVLIRLIEAYENGIEAGLEEKYDEQECQAIIGVRKKCVAFKELFPHYAEDIDFFLWLRQIIKSPIEQKLNEYRRHVTLVTRYEGEPVHVKIETVEEFYHRTKQFINDLATELYGERPEKQVVRKNHWIIRQKDTDYNKEKKK